MEEEENWGQENLNKKGEKMKTMFDGELGRGTVWALQSFDDLSANDIAEVIGNGWTSRQVKGELRRLFINTFLGCEMVRNKKRNGRVTYSLNERAKHSDFNLLCDWAARSYRFGVNVSGRIF